MENAIIKPNIRLTATIDRNARLIYILFDPLDAIHITAEKDPFKKDNAITPSPDKIDIGTRAMLRIKAKLNIIFEDICLYTFM